MILVMVNNIGPRPIGTAIIAIAVAAILLGTACSDETPTTGSDGEEAADQSPTAEVFAPTPSPTPTTIPLPTFTPTPTPISFSVALPLPPTATPRPTSTPDPDAAEKYIEELLTLVEEQLPTTRLYPKSFVLDDGRIVFAGGLLPTVGNNGLFFGGPHPFIEVYDSGADSWSLLDPIVPLLSFVDAVMLANGDILILGIEEVEAASEEDVESIPHAAYVLDGESLEVSRVLPPIAPRVSPDLVLMDDGRVAALGGIDVLSESSIFDVPVSLAVEIYDPALDMWVDAATQPGGLTREFNFWGQDETSQWVFPMDGSRVLTVRVGELIGDEDSIPDDVVRVDSFDAMTNTWELEAMLHMSFSDQPWHATASADGIVNILYANRIESFNPSNGEWSISFAPESVILTDPDKEESFTFERQALPRNSSITELPDGRYLVAGGERGGYSTLPRSTTVVYDPATKLWALGPELDEPRVGHSVTILDDGSVMLFGGSTIWEENESEGIPTNSMEIISAAEIAAVDTVTIPTTDDGEPIPPVDHRCWNASSTPVALPEVSINRSELPEPLKLLTDALDATKEAASFEMTSRWFDYEGEPGLSVMEARDSSCSFISHEYEAPNSFTSEFQFFQNRSFNGRWTSLVAEGTHYNYSQSEGLWKVGGQAEDDEIQRALEILPQETLDDSTIEWTTVAIEELDGLNTYHVRGDKTGIGNGQHASTFHFWIGVDDNLVRRTYQHTNEPDYNDAEKRRQTYGFTEVSSFGEAFNIVVPITPEEAMRPEVSGEQQCRAIEDLESLPQTTVSGGTVLDSVGEIVSGARQAMEKITSYATLHLTLGYQRSKDPENLIRIGGDCRYRQIEISEPDRLSSRDILFDYGNIESDAYRIVVGLQEYTRPSRDGDWTLSELATGTAFARPHREFVPPSNGAPGINSQLVGIESLDGVAVYHVSEHEVASGDGSERTLSVWIGVHDLLVRRVSIVTRMDDPDQNVIGGGAITVIHHLINFHSFNEDFNIQPPPEDEIAE